MSDPATPDPRPPAAHALARPAPRGRYLLALALGAVGVVYGDIGTSVLYAVRECFAGEYGVTPSRTNVLGVLSLIFWTLVITVSVKYLVFILRADNRGEGGILALIALLRPERGLLRASPVLISLGLFGAALLYGDGMITPAISVLSAVEGLAVATPVLQPVVVPLTLGILIALFAVQRHGTGRVGAVFGPVMLIWFLTIAALGLRALARDLSVLEAVHPGHAVGFFAHNRAQGFFVLGAVFLVATGSEALYADMGHFGRRPIRLAWFAVVLPALLANYFGQGALLLHDPSAATHPFYGLAPEWALYPLVGLATTATVIASQAVISGAFSLTRQAIQLGYSPRLPIAHTSAREIGQIYIPPVNWALMLACIGLVLGFQSSSRLAAAYGVAVSTLSVITTVLFYAVTRTRWGWSRAAALPIAATFLTIDLAFFGANLAKITHGGWFPVLVAAGVYTLLSTWKRGRELLADRLRVSSLPLETFVHNLAERRVPVPRVPGTAIFMSGDPTITPGALLHNLKHNKVLHERVVVLTVMIEEVPYVPGEERLEIEDLGENVYRIIVHYGFMQDPDVPRALELASRYGLEFKPMQTTYFLGRETLIPRGVRRPRMALWREKLFAFMAKNAESAMAFFRIPPNRVVELGAQIEL